MSALESVKSSAVRSMVSGALSILRVTPDRILTAGADRCLRDIHYPEGRDFLKTILLLAKRHLHRMSPAVQKSVLNFVARLLLATKFSTDFWTAGDMRCRCRLASRRIVLRKSRPSG